MVLILTMVSFHDGNSLYDSEEILTEKRAVDVDLDVCSDIC